MFVVDVANAVGQLGGVAAAAGAVGGAVTSAKVFTSAFRYCRQVLGYSPTESVRLARQYGDGVRDLDGAQAGLRQMEKDYEAMGRELDGSGEGARLRQMEKDYEAMWEEQSRG